MSKQGKTSQHSIKRQPNRASLQAKLNYERIRERHLKEQNVTVVLHLFYEDVMSSERLCAKLIAGGVPRIHPPRKTM